jgi:aldose sugar dehydrogenase
MERLLGNRVLMAGIVLSAVVAIGYITIGFPSQSDPGIRTVTVVDGLHYPWSLAFLPGGNMLVTEKYTAHLRIIRNGTLDPAPITNLPVVYPHAQGGLLEVALHPRYAQNQVIYISYSKPGDRGSTTALGQARFDGNTLTDYKDIFVAEAWSRDNGQYGGKIAFGTDGTLYLTVGDRRDRPRRAQDLSDDGGKIVRLRDDGSIPEDNPFVGQSNARPEIYAYGFRNQYGLVIDPKTGNMFENEMGPLGGDELNLIQPGRNYGWPVITYGREYSGARINGGLREKEGMEQPLAYWVPSISPAGMALYTGDAFPQWKGNLFIGAHGSRHLRRIVLDGTTVVHQELLLTGLREQIRDVRQGPDGLLYVITDGDPGSVLRLEPAPN